MSLQTCFMSGDKLTNRNLMVILELNEYWIVKYEDATRTTDAVTVEDSMLSC